MNRLRRWLEHLALTLGGILLAALLAELGLRLAGVSYPRFYGVDPLLGNVLRPGARGWYRDGGKAWVEINNAGMHDRKRSPAKPPNTFRIAVLGDSFTEGLQVPLDRTYCSVLERELSHCSRFAGRNVEVLNFGEGGFGTAQEFLLLHEKVRAFAPDLVLLAFYTNDLADNSVVLASERVVDHYRPFFVERNEKWTLETPFHALPAYRFRRTLPGRLLYGAVDYSRVFQVLREAKIKLAGYRARQRLGGSGMMDLLMSTVDPCAFDEPRDQPCREAWQTTEHLFLLIRDELKESGCDFRLVTLSTSVQAYPDARVREDVRRRMGVRDLFYYDRRIGNFGERENIPVLDLAPVMESYADEHHAYLHGFERDGTLGAGHWNEEGHRVAGQLMARWLCQDAVPRNGGEKTFGGSSVR